MLSTRHRRAASVALVALALVGVRQAAAAGPLGLVGVGSPVTEVCSTSAITVDYDVEYVVALQGHGVSAARLSGLDERCRGHDAVVTLSGPGGVPLAELSGAVEGDDVVLVVPPASPVAAEALTGVSVVLRAGA